ncbi:MAG: TonB-dependent receptor [Cyclobacteriaceae bacterium]
MKYFSIGFLAIALACPLSSSAQKLMGLVVEKDAKGKDQPLAGANIYWLGTTQGSTTRDNGVFLIDRLAGNDQLVISFVGYRTDTIHTTDQTNIKVELKPDLVLQEVVVEGWKPSTVANLSSGINVIEMGEKELFKAACCNLSESFETNPSVDVAFTDALTGTKQIQMLGLAGANTLISLENMPGVRGLAASQGIQFIPGTWINSIQVTKGVGSVVNSYESIAGQINVELKKPQESDKFYVNGYVNNTGRTEVNTIFTTQVSKKWATTFLLHGSMRPLEIDQNKDSFLDFPSGQQVNFVNRWVYNSNNGWLGQLSFKYLNDHKLGGQTGFNSESDKFTSNRYGLEINTERLEFVGKLGYQFPSKPYKSFGLQLSALSHMHDSYFGFNVHNANEESAYVNLIYQSIINNTSHKFKTGLSFLYDRYIETLGTNSNTGQYDFSRTEQVNGAFFEYSYDDLKKFSLVAGLRTDYHNLFGFYWTPRLHAKYNLTETTTMRASFGRGWRLANIIAENSAFLASSRSVVLSNQQTNKAYGFRPDDAWNYGLTLQQDFTFNYKPGNFSFDYFYTDFANQVVMDWDKSAREINFFGLAGKSFSYSIQAQVDYQLARRLDVRIAYRWLDVQTDYLNGRLQRPMVPRDRAFINLAYKTKNNWSFDWTLNRIGVQRLPDMESNPIIHQLPSQSEPYFLMNAQVTKDFGDKWSAYVGGENLNNFTISNPIVAASAPFGPHFDSSMIWGPIFGTTVYAGFRYRVK